MKKLFLILLQIVTISLLPAQNALGEANELFLNGCYSGAYPVYLEEIKKHPNDAGLNYRLGVSLLHSRSMKAASLPYLRKAVSGVTGTDKEKIPASAYRLLGEAYFHNRKFDSAQVAYDKYRSTLDPNNPSDAGNIEEVKRAAEVCKIACEIRDEALTMPSEKKFPPHIDLSGAQYSSELTADKKFLIHTFRVPTEAQRNNENSKYFEPTIIPAGSETTGEVKKINLPNGSGLDTVVYSTTIGASLDGQIILTYRNERNDAALYLARLKNNKWTAPEKLKEPANPLGWEPFEYVSPDGNTMYFASNRAGGYGGYDIYKCTRTKEGTWSKAANVGAPVNTRFDDVAPYIHPDGVTLYFSSNRVKPGSYDIFTSHLSGSKWSEPSNVGYPVNRNDNDIFQVDEKRKTPPPPTAIKELKKEKRRDTLKTQEKENFLVTVLNQDRTPMTLMVGEVTNSSGQPVPNALIKLSDAESGDLLGNFTTNSKGKYALILIAGRKHHILYEAPGLLFHTEHVAVSSDQKQQDRHREISMPPLQKESKTTLTGIFFEPGKSTFTSQSKIVLDEVHQFMTKNPGATINLSHWIITKDHKKENKKLARERAVQMASYLVNKGVSSSRIEASGGRLSSVPAGHSKKKKKDKTAAENIAELTELEIKTIN